MIKTNPLDIYNEYIRLTEYLMYYDVYEQVKINENFYIGKQWINVKADGMPKPVINVLQRVVKYFIATLSTNDVSISMIPFSDMEADRTAMDPIVKEVENVIEQAKIKEKSRRMIRDGAVDGSSYLMLYFNPDFETHQDMKGRIEAKMVDNTSMYFGNPYSNDIQSQPYIIVALRQYIGQVRDEAKSLGLGQDVIDSIAPDNEGLQANENTADQLVTVMIKFFRKREKVIETEETIDLEGNPKTITKESHKDSIWFTKCTRNVTLIEPTDLGYSRYPIACFGWDEIKNSYLYTSPLTAVIPNQIFINKTYAIAQMYGINSVAPKIIYDKNKVNINEFLSSTSPQAVASLDIIGKYLDFIKMPDFSGQIINLVQDVMQQTKECMGVNDASLGNVKPDNTSAIIALQEASTVPLELQRQRYYEFWEDTVRNILDIMVNTYGKRLIMTDDNMLAEVDFSRLKDLNYNLSVDIGSGAQYSEISQINTLDKLLQNGLVEPDTYIETIPNKLILGKNKILEDLKRRKEMEAQMPIPVKQP